MQDLIQIQSNTAERALLALAARMGPTGLQRFMLRWAVGTKAKAQRNALTKGGRRLWREIARSVNVAEVSTAGARILTTHPAAAQKQFGGPISAPGKGPWAKGAQSLAIPLSGSPAEGRMPGEFKGLFRIPGTNVLAQAIGARGSRGLRILFALVKRTKPQKASPWWPETAVVNRLGVKLAAQMLLEGGAS